MHAPDFIQLALYLAALVALTPLLGGFMARVFSGARHFLLKPLGWLERLIYRASGVAKYFAILPAMFGALYVASGATSGPTSADLVKAIAERREKFGAQAPDELLTASTSGLDTHLSPPPQSGRQPA